MTVHTLYRSCIWLPLVVPAVCLGVYLLLGLSPANGVIVEVLVYSLVYGGIPYGLLALWATWWVGGRSEAAIRRLMFLAPLLMIALFAVLALAAGIGVGQVRMFSAVAALGSVVILVLGYAYVALTVMIRELAGSRLAP
jgi:hypothetical protein